MTDIERIKRRWGMYFSLHEGCTISEAYKIKILFIDSDKSISLQYHNHREEYWVIMQGTGELQLETSTEIQKVKRGDTVKIPKRTIHKIKNTGHDQMIILELQIGEETKEEDIVRLEKIDGEI